jgi:hypothetical protein
VKPDHGNAVSFCVGFSSPKTTASSHSSPPAEVDEEDEDLELEDLELDDLLELLFELLDFDELLLDRLELDLELLEQLDELELNDWI